MSETDERETELRVANGGKEALEDEDVEVDDGEDEIEQHGEQAEAELSPEEEETASTKASPSSPSEQATTPPPPPPSSSGTNFNADMNNLHSLWHLFNHLG